MGNRVSSPLTDFRFLVAHAAFRTLTTGENREVGRDAPVSISRSCFGTYFGLRLIWIFKIGVVFDTFHRGSGGGLTLCYRRIAKVSHQDDIWSLMTMIRIEV
jgi:hypothetical protein